MSKVILAIIILNLVGCGYIETDGIHQVRVWKNTTSAVWFDSGGEVYPLSQFRKSNIDMNLDLLDDVNTLEKGDVCLIEVKDRKIISVKIQSRSMIWKNLHSQ